MIGNLLSGLVYVFPATLSCGMLIAFDETGGCSQLHSLHFYYPELLEVSVKETSNYLCKQLGKFRATGAGH